MRQILTDLLLQRLIVIKQPRKAQNAQNDVFRGLRVFCG